MADSGLKFEIEDVQNQNSTYSSLTDMNDIDVFTTSFREQINAVQESDNQKIVSVEMQLFLKDEEIEDNSVVQSLFMSDKNRTIKQDIQNLDENIRGYEVIGLFLILTLFVTAFYIRYRREASIKTKKLKVWEENL